MVTVFVKSQFSLTNLCSWTAQNISHLMLPLKFYLSIGVFSPFDKKCCLQLNKLQIFWWVERIIDQSLNVTTIIITLGGGAWFDCWKYMRKNNAFWLLSRCHLFKKWFGQCIRVSDIRWVQTKHFDHIHFDCIFSNLSVILYVEGNMEEFFEQLSRNEELKARDLKEIEQLYMKEVIFVDPQLR